MVHLVGKFAQYRVFRIDDQRVCRSRKERVDGISDPVVDPFHMNTAIDFREKDLEPCPGEVVSQIAGVCRIPAGYAVVRRDDRIFLIIAASEEASQKKK